jgi:hypothetical protein
MVVDSNQKELTVQEIIKIGAEQSGVKRPLEEVMHMLTIELTMPNIWKCRQGNTLFVVHKTAHPGYGYFRAINADTAKNFLENSKAFADSAYKVGFDILVTQFMDPSILNIFKMISRNPVRKNMGYQAQKTNDGGLQVTLQLGPQRGGKKWV